MLLDDLIRQEISGAVLCWCATVDAQGMPNVSPKEVFAPIDDDRFVIADIASPGTVRNLRVHPGICISLIDVFRQTGAKLTGTARVVGRDDPQFDDLSVDLRHMVGDRFPIRHVILANITQVQRLVAPSYRLYPEMTVQHRIDEAMRSYGVRPL